MVDVMTTAFEAILPFNSRMLDLAIARQRYDSEPTQANRARRTGAEQTAFDALRVARPHLDPDTFINLLSLIPAVTGSLNPNGLRSVPRPRTA